MAKQALSNSFTDFNGRVGTFVGLTARAAGKLSVGRLDGTGISALNAAAYTTSTALPILVLYYGDSHLAGGPQSPPADYLRLILPYSGAYAAVLPEHNFALSGQTAQVCYAQALPPLLAYIAANKANYSQIIVLLEGWINSLAYANGSETASLISLLRDASYQMVRAGAKVITIPAPSSRYYLVTGNTAQMAILEKMRTDINNDAIDNYLAWGANSTLPNYRQDTQLYTLDFYVNYPQYSYDTTHYTNAGYKAWTDRHILPAILQVTSATVPIRAVPTALVVDTAAKSFTFSSASPLPLCDYSINGGSTYAPVTTYPIPLPDGDYQAGAIRVRVTAFGGGQQSNSLFNTTAYTIGTPPIVTPPGFVPVVFRESANADISGNNWTSTQVYDYTYSSIVYSAQKFDSGIAKVRTTYDTSLPQTAFTGFRGANEPIITSSPVPAPKLGFRMSGNTCGIIGDSGESGSFPISNGDVIELVRDGNDLIYHLNGVEMYRNQIANQVGELVLTSMTAYPGAGLRNVQVFSNNLTTR